MNSIFDKVRKRFAFSQDEFVSYVQTAPHRYKTYKIPKRSGHKKREISQPSKDLKAIQRFILSEFLTEKLKVSSFATAYRVGKNICDNVRPHVSNRFLLKMDFENFFPSIRGEDFESYLLRENILASESDAKTMTKIFFKNSDSVLRLTIGSPGSPAISNALLREFDDSVVGLIGSKKISYTRYSDDLSFSTNTEGALFDLHESIHELTKQIKSPQLNINKTKTVFSSKKFNRHVTGITISNDARMSLGHSTKRGLRTRVFEASSATPHELASLKGYLSFVGQVEPDFLGRLRSKYPEKMALIDTALGNPPRALSK